MSTLVPGLENLARAFGEEPRHITGDALPVLRRVAEELSRYQAGSPPVRIPLNGLGDEGLANVAQSLAKGEVGITVGGNHAAEILESVFPGVWQVRPAGGGDYLEVGEFPSLALKALEEETDATPPPTEAPDDAMNVRPLLVEIGANMDRLPPGGEAYAINLSRMPMSLIDMAILDDALGMGPVTALSRGYGDCRIAATGHRKVWRVRHFNADDKMILDSIEIIDIPVAARALKEDMDDGGRRLANLIADRR